MRPLSEIPQINAAVRAVAKQLFMLRRLVLTYVLLVAVLMSVAASLASLNNSTAAKSPANAECGRDKLPACTRPTLV